MAERADVEVCDIWLEMFFIIGLLDGIYFLSDVFHSVFFDQASDVAGLSDHLMCLALDKYDLPHP